MPDSKYTNNQIFVLINQLKNGNTNALKTIFNLYSERLFYYAFKFINNKEIAEEIVQDVFIAIWMKRAELNIQKSVESYLYSSVKNRSISYLRKKISKVKINDLSYAENISDNGTNETSVEYKELENGVIGDPTAATREKGEKLVTTLVDNVELLINDIRTRWPLGEKPPVK